MSNDVGLMVKTGQVLVKHFDVKNVLNSKILRHDSGLGINLCRNAG
jgi:hypothetical protein